MSRIKGKNTKGELEVRRKLRTAGLSGYRLQWTKKWRIDAAFPSKK
jgi:DNA mismatch endonuclease (patch repair protein)